MDKVNNKKALLSSIRLSEDATFEYDEKAILGEYEKLGENKSSLAIKILSVLGGLIATISFLCFLFLAGIYDSKIGACVVGGVLIVFAILLNKEFDKLIIDTISVSSYITGFILLAYGLLEMDLNENIVSLLVCVVALLSLFITQNYILSFISILVISCSSLTTIMSNNLYNLIHLYIASSISMLTYLMLNEAKLIASGKKISKLYDPIRIGLIVSLLIGLSAMGKRNLIPISQNHIWLSSISIIFITIYLVYRILKINKIVAVKSKIMIYALSILVLIPTILSPSISGAMLIILLSFLVNYKTGFAIGIISFIYFISQYYYDLSLTLFTKSIMLFLSGIMFLSFYLFTLKKTTSNEKI